MKSKHYSGFTLIELLVVIAVIGLLSAILMVSLSSARNKSKDARVVYNVQQSRTGIDLNYNGTSYPCLTPTAGSGVQINVPGSLLAGCPNITNLTLLFNDTANQGGAALTYRVTTLITNVVTAYAIYGSLPSKSNASYFCADSKGNVSLGTSTALYITCN
ncbi:MAG: type II secretion system protein [Candidatus Taylorbacteria bacterium]|nr:type II secretion system protein [Candidatus Taylorbacteria bacterium]